MESLLSNGRLVETPGQGKEKLGFGWGGGRGKEQVKRVPRGEPKRNQVPSCH